MQLMGSQFPDQGSNPGHGGESAKSDPLDHQGTPAVLFSSCAFSVSRGIAVNTADEHRCS